MAKWMLMKSQNRWTFDDRYAVLRQMARWRQRSLENPAQESRMYVEHLDTVSIQVPGEVLR